MVIREQYDDPYTTQRPVNKTSVHNIKNNERDCLFRGRDNKGGGEERESSGSGSGARETASV